jgi:hypothetical protein
MIIARQISHGNWSFQFDASDGRFRPVYWLSFALVNIVFGLRPFWFFIINTLVLVGTAACLIQLILNLGKGRQQAWLTGVLFILASPVIENYYTLSKGEPWQLVFLALSLLLLSRYKSADPLRIKIGKILSMAAFLLLANLAKETSVVMIPVALVWYIFSLVIDRKRPARSQSQIYLAYLVGSLIAAAVFLLLRISLASGAMNIHGYSSLYVFTLEQIQASLIRWTSWVVRDFPFITPLIIGMIIIWGARKKLPQAMLLFQSLVWAAAWIVVFLPWYYMAEYYMLPAAFGLAVFCGALLTEMLKAWQKELKSIKWIAGMALVCFTFLLAFVLLGEMSSARIQLAVDASNSQALRTVANEAPMGSNVFINIQYTNEYVDEIAMQLNALYDRGDLFVNTFKSWRPVSTGTYFILAPLINNQPLLTVRMGVVEATQNNWNASLQNYIAAHPGWGVSAIIEQKFGLTIIDLPRLLCPLIKSRAFCATPSPLVDLRPFTYGWTIYSIDLP